MGFRLKWFDVLSLIGLVVLVAPFVAPHPLPGKPNYYVGVGAALILAHVFLRGEDLIRAVGRRQLRYGGNMLVFSVAVLAILFVVNYIVANRAWRWDFTKDQRFALSQQTKKLLGGLKDELKLTYFVNAEDPQDQGRAEDRLREYQAQSSRIKVTYVNPEKSPRVAHQYGITFVPALVVERADRQEKINNVTEQDITNAVIKVTRDKKTICFVKGEGERDLEDSSPRGYSQVKQALEGGSYAIQSVSLFGEEKLLAPCSALIIPGPEKDLLPEGVERVRRFVKAGGKALVMIEPEYKESFPNLVGLLKEWNIQAGQDVLLQVAGLQLTPRGLQPVADETIGVDQYPYHEITKDMRGVATVFRSVRSVQAGTASVSGVNAQNFLESAAEAWADADLSLKAPSPDKGRRGPVPFGVVATLNVAPPSPAPSPSPSPDASRAQPEARVVVVGDCDFASNVALRALGNRDLFLNSVAWLLRDTDLISIRPREEGQQRLKFRTGDWQETVIIGFAVVLMPLAFVVWGVVVWFKRR